VDVVVVLASTYYDVCEDWDDVKTSVEVATKTTTQHTRTHLLQYMLPTTVE